MIALFNDPSSVFYDGITVNGNKYVGIRGDSQSIYGKKEAGGVILVKTVQSKVQCK